MPGAAQGVVGRAGHTGRMPASWSPALVENVGEKPRNRWETKVHPGDDRPMMRLIGDGIKRGRRTPVARGLERPSWQS